MQAMVVGAVKISRFFAYVGAITVVVMMLLICFDVMLREVFRVSWNPTPEIVARYLMVGMVFLPLSWLEFRKQMISVELLDFALSPWMRRASDLSVMVAATGVYGVLAYSAWTKALKEAGTGTLVEIGVTKMAVWHSYFLPPIGFSLGAVACLIAAAALVLPRLNAQLEAALNER